MPFDRLDDLPDQIKDNLPRQAQEIWMEAYNSALSEYGEEETAAKVAWAAVKNKYKKSESGEWSEK